MYWIKLKVVGNNKVHATMGPYETVDYAVKEWNKARPLVPETLQAEYIINSDESYFQLLLSNKEKVRQISIPWMMYEYFRNTPAVA